jgi:hypothetical protein
MVPGVGMSNPLPPRRQRDGANVDHPRIVENPVHRRSLDNNAVRRVLDRLAEERAKEDRPESLTARVNRLGYQAAMNIGSTDTQKDDGGPH